MNRTGAIVLSVAVVVIASLASRLEVQAESASPTAPPPTRVDWIESQMPSLLRIYQNFHSNPELSLQESETAATLAELCRAEGLDVTTGIGGHGIVGILKNGKGPTVMLRTDLDGLPVTEQTPLPFASTKTVSLPGGVPTGVMHACGHDVHMTNLVGSVRYLAGHRDLWSGTLMVIGQPAEEIGEGAKAMLADGLFERFDKPDYAVAIHVAGDQPAGKVGIMPGFAQANVDSVDIDVKGRGGHGSAPEKTIDPIVQAAELVVALQTIVSREVDPQEPAVVTVGSIHGGTKHNIIGDSCHLQLTVRTYNPEVRKAVLAAIERKANAVATSHNAPPPEVIISQGTPSLFNDLKLAARMTDVFAKTIGPTNLLDNTNEKPSMGGEDFSRYGIAGVPILMVKVGSVSQARLDRFVKLGVPPASLHSAEYYPEIVPTLETSIQIMTAAAIDLMPPTTDPSKTTR